MAVGYSGGAGSLPFFPYSFGSNINTSPSLEMVMKNESYQSSLIDAKILIVEDEVIIAMGLEDSVHDFGYLVAGRATTGQRAIDLAMETQPDLALIDIRLDGDMDGIEAAEKNLAVYLKDRFVKVHRIDNTGSTQKKHCNKENIEHNGSHCD